MYSQESSYGSTMLTRTQRVAPLGLPKAKGGEVICDGSRRWGPQGRGDLPAHRRGAAQSGRRQAGRSEGVKTKRYVNAVVGERWGSRDTRVREAMIGCLVGLRGS